jgi:hypothetical protein
MCTLVEVNWKKIFLAVLEFELRTSVHAQSFLLV